ncbi:sigma-E factor negative regulatory protein RseA [Pseudomonas duriflava]|uniref:Sigma-E factor negative regulatory protein RseA n=1 Tax=Pseudomonas duriflava TaxID=459528 RepID=A0A562QQ32_9PSED|nr:RseA family anti-sigma factor [Pseudomonas duriflava]TWI58783.1 sigma-E factor negative regulatory protein RseA [Pseudomonas duriflava]
MNREALLESLSAVMDNEADELEVRRVLAATDQDAELRATWSRYVMARAVIRNEPVMPKLDIAAAVSAALENEETPVVAQAAKPKVSRWNGLSRVAVAASVTVAVLAGVRLYNQDSNGAGQLAQQTPAPITVPQVQSPAVLANYSEEGSKSVDVSTTASTVDSNAQMPDYIRQHAQQATFNSVDGTALPYARGASVEDR